MTEAEKAILLMLAAQNEYLHIIAWAHRNGPTNGEIVAASSLRLARQLHEHCPSVTELMKP